MKHGTGKLLRPDGSTYHGRWEGNVVVGTGKVTFAVGDQSRKDGLPKEVRVLRHVSATAATDDRLLSDHDEGLQLLGPTGIVHL